MLHIIVKFDFYFMEGLKLKLNERQQEVIREVLKGREPSKEQINLINFILKDTRNATVNSVAGSGKSTTIELLAKIIDPKKKVLIIAFNKEIQQNLEDKFPEDKKKNSEKDKHVAVKTYHSFGFSILRNFFSDWRFSKGNDEYTIEACKKWKNKFVSCIKPNKYEEYVHENINDISSHGEDKGFKGRTLKLIDYARYDCCMPSSKVDEKNIAPIKAVAEKYEIKCKSDECETALKILEWGKNHFADIDFIDMEWLPLAKNIPAVYSDYDFVFIDEAQDSSLIQQELFWKWAMKRGTRFIAFGDPRQTINAWCGADRDAFGHFAERKNTVQLNLSTSFRCPKAVARVVQPFNKDFSVAENNIEGEVNYLVSPNKIKNGDLVLCRLTSPLVELYLQFLKEGKKPRIVGLEIMQNLRDIMAEKETYDPALDWGIPVEDSMTKEEFIKNLFKKSIFENLVNQKEKSGFTYWKLFSDEHVYRIYDAIISLELFAKDVKNVGELKAKLNEAFGPDVENDDKMLIEEKNRIKEELRKNTISLSTVHRTKGKEADNVFIICNSKLQWPLGKPKKKEKKSADIETDLFDFDDDIDNAAVQETTESPAEECKKQEEEDNVTYVAYTRALKTLNFVDEHEVPPPMCLNNQKENWENMKEKAQEYGITFNEETGEILEEK